MGGRFPKEAYDRIIDRIQDIVNFASLISYASATYSEMYRDQTSTAGRVMSVEERDASQSQWLLDFRRLIHDAGGTSKEITTLLTLLSASVASGQPLPPYLKPPEPYALSAKLETLDSNILSVRHMAEPGFAAFAVMQIGTKFIGDDLKALLDDVRELVGELDFSFHVVSTSEHDSAESSRTTLLDDERERSGDKGKRE